MALIHIIEEHCMLLVSTAKSVFIFPLIRSYYSATLAVGFDFVEESDLIGCLNSCCSCSKMEVLFDLPNNFVFNFWCSSFYYLAQHILERMVTFEKMNSFDTEIAEHKESKIC